MTHSPARGQQPILTHFFATNTIQLLKISICSAAKVPRLERAGHGFRSNRSSSNCIARTGLWSYHLLSRTPHRSRRMSGGLSGKKFTRVNALSRCFARTLSNARAVSLAQLENQTWRTKIRVPVYSEDRPFSGLITRTEPYLCRCAKSSG